jgi:hypothetical protein
LRRPDGLESAAALTNTYAASEPVILRNDFYHSLLAAYRVDEIQAQLRCAGIDWLTVSALGDRHIIAYGTSP